MRLHEKEEGEREARDVTGSPSTTGITRITPRLAHHRTGLREATGTRTDPDHRRYAPAEKLNREQLHLVRDFAIMVRQRRLRSEKGRRKDLRKIESLISDLRPLVNDE